MISTIVNALTLMSRTSMAEAQRVIRQAAERLATGHRINRASDDPSGLIAADRLGARRVELTEMIAQAERAGFVLSAVEGGLAEMDTLLQDLNGLVVQAASTGGLGGAEREALQVEANGIIQALGHLIGTYTFDGKLVLAEGATVTFNGGAFGFGGFDLKTMGVVHQSAPAPEAPASPQPPVTSEPDPPAGGTPAPGTPPDPPDPTRLSLLDIMTGGALNLVDGDLELTQRSIAGALKSVHHMRGTIGAHLKYVLGSGMTALMIELENTAAAESVIRDADYAHEVASLIRGQIMEMASIKTFQLAKDQAFNALALLG
ncbi:MAG: flagellin [Phycisphaerales bacterium]